MGRAFEELGWEVTSLDVDPKASPTICADICSWEPLPKFAPGYFAPSWLACLGGMSAIAPTATRIASSPGSGATWTGCPSNPCVALAVTAVSGPEGLVAIAK